MATINPFQCVRPKKELASQIAALPYDVYSREEAKKEVLQEPLSFLRIDRAETQFRDSVSTYDDRVYLKAKELLDGMIADGSFITDEEAGYYIYEQIMDGRSQTGIVACAAIDDYLNNTIKKHEDTREEKELDRIKHVDRCNAQTGPIFLAYRSNLILNRVVAEVKKSAPEYYFISADDITHYVWKVTDPHDIHTICATFESIHDIYIADGHHRAASAVKVGLKRRKEVKNYTGKEPFNFFLSVLFPDDQLMIMPYNRCVKDLNGLKTEAFLQKVQQSFVIKEIGKQPIEPKEKGSFGMYVSGKWYLLEAKEELKMITDPVLSLDVSLLQNYLLKPILGIDDPRTDKRIDFIGGIRGLVELQRRAEKDMKVAFSMYPTSIEELFQVSDANKRMPPKSTWFEPKLRSGLFIHRL